MRAWSGNKLYIDHVTGWLNRGDALRRGLDRLNPAQIDVNFKSSQILRGTSSGKGCYCLGVETVNKQVQNFL